MTELSLWGKRRKEREHDKELCYFIFFFDLKSFNLRKIIIKGQNNLQLSIFLFQLKMSYVSHNKFLLIQI